MPSRTLRSTVVGYCQESLPRPSRRATIRREDRIWSHSLRPSPMNRSIESRSVHPTDIHIKALAWCAKRENGHSFARARNSHAASTSSSTPPRNALYIERSSRREVCTSTACTKPARTSRDSEIMKRNDSMPPEESPEGGLMTRLCTAEHTQWKSTKLVTMLMHSLQNTKGVGDPLLTLVLAREHHFLMYVMIDVVMKSSKARLTVWIKKLLFKRPNVFSEAQETCSEA
mmetsp:Transcript_12452/g.30527  ORF Transcript_12452/g.30527 Transcript_12452/m.30527 type:complete len:229 (-) Transcript_12452:310-996(-)